MRALLLGLSAIFLANCAGTVQNAALENRVEQLEAQLAQVKQEKKQVVQYSEDPLYETYKALHSINNSVVHDVSALSYVQGNYGASVNVYPLDKRSANPHTVLKERTEQYPRHIMQLGQDVYTENYSDNVLLYPIDDPYSALQDVVVEPIEQTEEIVSYTASNTVLKKKQGRIITQAAPAKTAGRRLTGY